MRHRATAKFWRFYAQLPESVRRIADSNYELLKGDPQHPSLHFKRIGRLCSVRIGIHYRAVGVEDDSGFVWFWIGHHSEYDRILAGRRK